MALHTSALEFGGIGGDRVTDTLGRPLCFFGHQQFVGMAALPFKQISHNFAMANDRVVECINKREGRSTNARVDYEAYIAEIERLYSVRIIPVEDVA